MNKINYRITLDAHKSGVQKTLHGFFAGDVLSRRIAISLVGGSTPCEYGENTAAVMYVTKPNGVTSYNACTVEENTIFYDVLQTDIDAAGIVTMQFKVMSGEAVLYAPEFAVEVQDSKNSDTQATTTPTYTALEEALVKAETAYNERLVSVDIEEDLTFVAVYADGTEQTSDAFKKAFAELSKAAVAEQGRVAAEQGRVVAEQQRVQAERERVAEYTSLKNSIADSAEKTITLQDDVQELVDHVLSAADGTAGEIEAPKLNADTLQGHSADYFASKEYVADAIKALGGGTGIDLVDYATEKYVDDAVGNISDVLDAINRTVV